MVTLVSLLSVGVLAPTALAEGDEVPADTPPTTSEVIVAVGQPPVPPTTTEVVVAVGRPPVPPTTTEVVVAVGRPPVPPTTSATTTTAAPRAAVPPAAIANRPTVTVAPPEMRVSDAAQTIAARLERLLALLP
jgi:hypothetical protein